MGTKDIIYFEQPKLRSNTDEMVKMGIKRAQELGISTVVIAWDSGYTLNKFLEMTGKESHNYNFIVVTNPKGGTMGGRHVSISDETRIELEEKGIKVCYTIDYLGLRGDPQNSGVNPKIRREKLASFGIPEHLRTLDIEVGVDLSLFNIISQGFRVCVGITVLAVKNGLIPQGEFVLSLGGIATGVILRASSNVRTCLVKEILGYDRKYADQEVTTPVGE